MEKKDFHDEWGNAHKILMSKVTPEFFSQLCTLTFMTAKTL